MPTVVIGSARDVVEHCGVPRFVFSDFPLGNPCGHPWRADMRREVVAMALSLIESAAGPRTTVVSPFAWKDDLEWRERYSRVDAGAQERLGAIGAARRRHQASRKGAGA